MHICVFLVILISVALWWLQPYVSLHIIPTRTTISCQPSYHNWKKKWICTSLPVTSIWNKWILTWDIGLRQMKAAHPHKNSAWKSSDLCKRAHCVRSSHPPSIPLWLWARQACSCDLQEILCIKSEGLGAVLELLAMSKWRDWSFQLLT